MQVVEILRRAGYLEQALIEAGRLLEAALKEIIEEKLPEDWAAMRDGKPGLGRLVGMWKKRKLHRQWNAEDSRWVGVNLDLVVLVRNAVSHSTDTSFERPLAPSLIEQCLSIVERFLVAVNRKTWPTPTHVYDAPSAQEAQALWQLREPRNLVIITAASDSSHTGQYRRKSTGIGQMRAMAYLAPSLTAAYPDIELRNVRLSDENLASARDADLLLLGGPKNNQQTRELLDLLQEQQPANQQGSVILWDGDEHLGDAEDDAVIDDFGLMIRTRNPFSPRDRTAVLLTGSHTHGTMAAAKFFAEELLRRHPRQVAANQNLSALVGCEIEGAYPYDMDLVKPLFCWSRAVA